MQVRVKGRHQGNICGPDEVNLVTTARANLWWVPLEGVDNQATAPASLSGRNAWDAVPEFPAISRHHACDYTKCNA